ncbi:MAG: BatA domain-containing protein, partial [bacterium]
MSFVAPYLLWLLPLAGIPLLFTWLNKQEIKTQDFPALHWLDDQLKSRLQRKNIRHWLQALWRVLILIVLIYTFARPVIGVQQKSISDTWVLVDNSPTMLQKQAGQTALETGKQWLQENFKDLDDNLRLGQINPEPRWLGRYSAAPDLPLENIKINENQTNLTELQKWLAEQSPPEGTRIILITNGRQGLLPDTSPKANVPTLEITAPFSLLQT